MNAWEKAVSKCAVHRGKGDTTGIQARQVQATPDIRTVVRQHSGRQKSTPNERESRVYFLGEIDSARLQRSHEKYKVMARNYVHHGKL